ncbi:MAG: hypothetical protein WD490_04805 [Opitutales bacterium]
MTTSNQSNEHEQWLVELTGIPTAAGREFRVIEWVKRWVAERPKLQMETDKIGNLMISQAASSRSKISPVFVTAHLDHPAFVVRRVVGPQEIELEFRGGVLEPYFEKARIEVIDAQGVRHPARLTDFDPTTKPFKTAAARLVKTGKTIREGDIARWAFSGKGSEPRCEQGLLYAHACDDLAAVAVVLAVIDALSHREGMGHVGALLTVAEEVGFVGATGACLEGTLPGKSRMICLENSRSFPESPIGGGPVLRVGDRSSIFSPALTNRIGMILTEYAKEHPQLRWQRKLMPGGTCEATAFGALGYESTCLCLPLGNYHNMIDIDKVRSGGRPAKVGPEFIALSDYHGMIEVLLVCLDQLDSETPPVLADRIKELYFKNASVLNPQNTAG